MDGLSPGQDGLGTVHRGCRGTECVVDCRAFLFRWRWESEESELRDGINLKNDRRHLIVTEKFLSKRAAHSKQWKVTYLNDKR